MHILIYSNVLVSPKLSWNNILGTDECVTLYEDECFNGKSQTFGIGKHDIVDLIIDKMLNEGVGNDSVSSLKVKKGYRVKLFEHVGFDGKMVTFGAGDYDINELHLKITVHAENIIRQIKNWWIYAW